MTPQHPAAPPAVSVVIATYNRTHTLRHAVQSVRNSSFTDWELIVVGDGCTDDTAECVASFNDPRIRFVNLPVRTGHQSGPNNHGIALSRGKYVAFLNHDDLYLPDHLGPALPSWNERRRPRLGGIRDALVPKPSRMAGCRSRLPLSAYLSPPSGFSPFATCLASCWVFRRDLADRVGPWQITRQPLS